MTEPEGIPERVARLEHEMLEVRADVKAARVLAAGADHDVSRVESTLRAQKDLIQALHRSQSDMHADLTDLRAETRAGFAEMRSKFAMIDAGFARVGEEFAKVDAGFAEMRSKFATVGLGMEQITALLTHEMNKPDGC